MITEKTGVTFALDCCDREALHWAVTTGGFDSETVQDVMLGAVERRFGSELPTSPVEWLTDNGSCYRANETRQFARMLGLEPKNTAVRSPESNGTAESFVKTIKRDYISIMPKPDGLTASDVRAHNRAANGACDEYKQLKVLSMGRQKAVIKARREAKRVLRRDSRSHKQREEESVTSLVQMSGVEAIGMARDSRDTSPILARNEAQLHYLKAIESKQLIFATGEAGAEKPDQRSKSGRGPDT